MITIEQLLESVDLDFEPRWVTKDQNGMVWVWDRTPYRVQKWWNEDLAQKHTFGCIKIHEFDGKDWTECICEVPRKTTGNIEEIEVGYNNSLKAQDWKELIRTHKALKVAVDALKGIDWCAQDYANAQEALKKITALEQKDVK